MIQQFLDYQSKQKGLSIQTCEGYEKDLRHFAQYASKRGLRWSTISSSDIDTYVQDERARGMQPRTIKKRVEVIRLLYSWMIKRSMLDHNPAWYTETPKVSDTLPKAADSAKIEQYLASPITGRNSYVIHALVALIYETGLRIGEVLSLRGTDINLQRRSIRIAGKGGTERYVYFSDLAASYCEVMTKAGNNIIFRQTDIEYRYMMISELPGVHPHAIRHAFACRQLNAGMPLKDLSVLMGHKHQQTTEIYAKMDTNRLAKVYRHYN